MFLAAILLALVLTVTLAASETNTTGGWIFNTIQPSADLIWLPCLTNLFCAMLDVPLDYAKPDGYRASVPLIKLPAMPNSSDGPYQGMILVNPGGPGDSGINFIISTGSTVQQATGSNFDIISFDPRGIGSSIPSANCTPPISKVRRNLPKLRTPKLLDSFFDAQFEIAQTTGAQCQALIGADDGAGQHMTTTVNARDMLSILNAFSRSPDGAGLASASMLQYWGFSYGTFLGQVFANMFPDRIGRVVLDGVVDPEKTVTGIDDTSLISTDEVISTFFVYCYLAGPQLCQFYTGDSARDIYRRFEKLIFRIDPRVAGVQNGTANSTVVEGVLELAKLVIFEIAYSPITAFPVLDAGLVVLEQLLSNGSYDAILELGNQVTVDPNVAIWETAVSCTDDGGASFHLTRQQLGPYIRKLAKESVIGGELWSTLRIQCTGWPIGGADRYAGPFGGSTQNPLLFVSNTLDPVTPLINGYKWSSQYIRAQLLTVEAQGHTTLNAQNICAFTKIHTYFQTGKLPGKHSYCKQEAGAFNVTLPDSIENRSDWNDIRGSLRKSQRLRH